LEFGIWSWRLGDWGVRRALFFYGGQAGEEMFNYYGDFCKQSWCVVDVIAVVVLLMSSMSSSS